MSTCELQHLISDLVDLCRQHGQQSLPKFI